MYIFYLLICHCKLNVYTSVQIQILVDKNTLVGIHEHLYKYNPIASPPLSYIQTSPTTYDNSRVFKTYLQILARRHLQGRVQIKKLGKNGIQS